MVILYLSKGIFLKNFYRILGITLTVVGLMQMKLNAQTIAEGEVLFQKGKYKEAKSIFEEILKKDDKNAEAHNDLGMVYLNRRNPEYDVDKAVDETEKAVNLAPNNANIQYGYGAALGIKVQNAGIIKQAMLAPKVKKAFLRAVELNPKHIQARVATILYDGTIHYGRR
jgi:Flp pilus assembly protein TadD